ncbi:hypothetical protein QYE76_024631 [Lolium multiflorum]|uniref:Uncharacterized protein n=1 Tax=Lolium multiflorum TaxID=4521 RepID=A0AAD8VTT5_LOLMU|nr:hypothetical protein QYE76_024631 [Lolium multiflorum]
MRSTNLPSAYKYPPSTKLLIHPLSHLSYRREPPLRRGTRRKATGASPERVHHRVVLRVLNSGEPPHEKLVAGDSDHREVHYASRPLDVPLHGRDDPMRATKDNLSADAIDKRIRVLIKIPRELHVHVCNKDIHTNGSGTALEALEENELGTLLRVPSTGHTDTEAASEAEAPEAPRPLRGRSQLLPAPMLNAPAKCLALRPPESEEKKRLSPINTSNKGQPAIQHFFKPSEETAKHSSFDELSAKVKVLEAENESLKAFIQESSSKETEARKELSEKHARDLAELNEKLERSQGRVISVVAKNKVLEAEAEAIDKLIFPSLGFEWSKESNLKRTEAYDEARISIDALFEAVESPRLSL